MADLLLLLDHGRNRTLLTDWLGDDHDVTTGDEALDDPFDLCLVDPPALARHREHIVERREEAAPLHLPVLLLVRSSHELNAPVWDVVDDVVEIPLPKRQFRARLRTHLRTRALSLDLQEQTEQLDRFATLLSHDLRNPLSVAQGYLEMAQNTGKAEHFERVDRALDRMEALITDALALARYGADAIEPKPVSLAAAAERAWSMVTTDGATLHTEDDLILADPDYLDELLENLYRNSVEHAGDDVTISVVPAEGGFRVTDDGPGIPESIRETAFDPGTTTKSGTGFGLAIVEEIASAHDWDVSIGESDDGGACIEFRGVESP